MSRSSPGTSVDVVVIAESRETIDGLHRYFRGAGLTSHGTRTLSDASKRVGAAAIVLFPDDFNAADVAATLLSVRRTQPKLRIVLVTGAPRRLLGALESDGRSLPLIILPKPAFGWTILDAVRGRATSQPT